MPRLIRSAREVRLVSILGILAVVLTAIGLAETAHSNAIKRYSGPLQDSPGARVKFTVRPSPGHDEVTFEARGVRLRCEDGSKRRTPIKPTVAHLHKRSFDVDEYFDVPTFGVESYVRVHGTLKPGRKARGYLLVFTNPLDPPDTDRNGVECTSAGGLPRWKARERE